MNLYHVTTAAMYKATYSHHTVPWMLKRPVSMTTKSIVPNGLGPD